MRTLIQGGWVVGYNNGGHELIPNGCVVFEDDRIVHVGRRFEGTVERRIEATGKLVSPGFVNCHLHAATNAGQAVFLDGLQADSFGSNFIGDRKSTRLNSSHLVISYAVFCLKKKKDTICTY